MTCVPATETIRPSDESGEIHVLELSGVKGVGPFWMPAEQRQQRRAVGSLQDVRP